MKIEKGYDYDLLMLFQAVQDGKALRISCFTPTLLAFLTLP